NKSHISPWFFDRLDCFNTFLYQDIDSILVRYVKSKSNTWIKTKVKLIEKHFVNKIVGRRITIVDGLDTRFKS
ncbi:unnamed protein product, partial [marine sediment metagenome]